MRRWLFGALAVILGAVIGCCLPVVLMLLGSVAQPIYMLTVSVAELVVPMPDSGNCMVDSVSFLINASLVWAVIGAFAGLVIHVMRTKVAGSRTVDISKEAESRGE